MVTRKRLFRITLSFLIAILFLLPSLCDLTYSGEQFTLVNLQDMVADVEDADPSDDLGSVHVSDSSVGSAQPCTFLQTVGRRGPLTATRQSQSLLRLTFTTRPPPIL